MSYNTTEVTTQSSTKLFARRSRSINLGRLLTTHSTSATEECFPSLEKANARQEATIIETGIYQSANSIVSLLVQLGHIITKKSRMIITNVAQRRSKNFSKMLRSLFISKYVYLHISS